MGLFKKKGAKGSCADTDFPFSDAPDTACIVCRHVIDKEKAITYISHDDDDGMWQFLCGDAHSTEDARLVSLYYAYSLDKSVGQVADMPCGCYIQRKNGSDDWK